MPNQKRNTSTSPASDLPANPFKPALPAYETNKRFADERVVFTLTALEHQTAAQAAEAGSSLGKARWVASVVIVETGEVAKLTFGVNEGRDAEMYAADEYLAKVGPIEGLILRQGRAKIAGQSGAFYINKVAGE